MREELEAAFKDARVNAGLDDRISEVIPGFKDMPAELQVAAVIGTPHEFIQAIIPLVAHGAGIMKPRQLFMAMMAVMTSIFDMSAEAPTYSEMGQEAHERGQRALAMMNTFHSIHDIDTTNPEDAA